MPSPFAPVEAFEPCRPVDYLCSTGLVELVALFSETNRPDDVATYQGEADRSDSTQDSLYRVMEQVLVEFDQRAGSVAPPREGQRHP